MSQTEKQVEVIITNYLQEGNQLREEGKLNEAMGTYQKGIELEPDNPHLHRCLAQVQTQQGDIPSAISSYQKTIELEPIQPFWVYQALSNCLFAQGLLEEAIAPLQEAISLQPGNAELYRRLAQILTEKQDFLGAIANYQKTIELDAKQPYWVYQALGNLLRQQGGIEDSIVAYSKAMELEPNNAELYGLLGQAYKKKGERNSAIANYQKAIALNDDGPAWLFASLGQVLTEEGRLEEAMATYKEAMDLYPNSADLRSYLGNVLLQQKKWDGAIAAYKEAIELNSDVPGWVHERLEEALMGQRNKIPATNQDPIALEWQEMAQNPQDAGACYRLGQAFAAREQWEEAISCYQAAIQLKPQHWQVYNELGAALMALNRYPEAEISFRQARELNKSILELDGQLLTQLEALHSKLQIDLGPEKAPSKEVIIKEGISLLLKEARENYKDFVARLG